MMERTQRLHQLLVLLLLLLALSFYFIVGSSKGYCIAEEREALLNFVRRSLIEDQLVLSHWKGEDCCSWKGVGCSNTTGHVIELDFSWYNEETISYVVGYSFAYSLNTTSLDPSLFLLEHLQYLGLSGIDFNKTRFPQSINALINLHRLDLSMSNFVGVIPPLSTNLRHLDLSGNDLTVSNLIWMSRLSSLQYLDMSSVNLTFATNWLHEINILPNLSTLILSGCNLQTLPSLLPYSNFSSTIKVLDLSGNQFSNSTIPSWLSNMTNIEDLNLSNNTFHGMVPSFLGSLYKLRSLDCSYNFIEGTIPEWIGHMRGLTELNLADNLLQGSLSDVNFANLSELTYLNLQYNLLQGNLPPMNSNVQHIYLSHNNFTMKIEWFLNQNISNLQSLELAQNNFSGEISDSICKMIHLEVFDLTNNNLKGEIPKCHSNFENLTFMSLANNNLQGLIPPWMENLPKLMHLNLKNNSFQGEISFLKNSILLIGLDLGQNNLTGSIPSWIGDRLLRLKFLRLRSNKFSGTIPTQLSKLKALQILDLAYNNLSGSLPKVFGFLNAMTKPENPQLPWYDNVLNPSWMVHIKGMQLEYTTALPLVTLLDLSYNNFIGEVQGTNL